VETRWKGHRREGWFVCEGKGGGRVRRGGPRHHGTWGRGEGEGEIPPFVLLLYQLFSNIYYLVQDTQNYTYQALCKTKSFLKDRKLRTQNNTSRKLEYIWIVETMVMALGETCWNKEEGYHLAVHFCTPDDALVVRNILSFYTNSSFSVCETT
jgi:hypothetical protein